MTTAQNKPEANLGRRALVQAGWAVPAVLAIGLPRIAQAGYGYGHKSYDSGGGYGGKSDYGGKKDYGGGGYGGKKDYAGGYGGKREHDGGDSEAP